MLLGVVRYSKKTELLDLKNKITLLEADKKFYLDRSKTAESIVEIVVPPLEEEIKHLREQLIQLKNAHEKCPGTPLEVEK